MSAVLRAGRAFWLSLVAAWAALAWASPEDELRRRLDEARSWEEVQAALQEAPAELRDDPVLQLKKAASLSRGGVKAAREAVAARLDLRESLLGPPDQPLAAKAAQERARKILQSPGYRSEDGRSRGWLALAVERIASAIRDFLESLDRPPPPGWSLGGLPQGLDRAVVGTIITLLVGGIGWFLVLAILRFRRQARRMAAGGGILGDDEEELTADQWLSQAAQLERQGRLREAVRCLYLAMLMRSDEFGVMRFLRGETNWEHERRFRRSPARPEGADLSGPTRDFDQIWYGYREAAPADVEGFRRAYEALLSALKQARRPAS
jgi:hypothetical protein